MYIPRDITEQIRRNAAYIQILIGPRQCGKSTLFASLKDNHFKEISFDDLQFRQLANNDPALFLQQFEPPLLLDEVQYVPNLLPQLKLQVDKLKRTAVFNTKESKKDKVVFRLTGSNQILMDKNVKESLAGRAAYFYLNTLSVDEILHALPETKMSDILFKGGWPEVYTDKHLSIINYLNDYIRTYVEKDIVLSAGIQKLTEFNTVLGLLAARTGQLIDFSDVAKNSGVSSVTVKEWTTLLERTDLVYLLSPYYSNLNNRLIKTPKLYFLDTGLAVRLQGWQLRDPLLTSPQIGPLFETLVLAEIVKFIRNYQKDWQLFFWRTKEGEEFDFILKSGKEVFVFESKLAIQSIPNNIEYTPSFKKQFAPKNPLIIVTFGGEKIKLSPHCMMLPIAELHDFLQQID